MSWTRRVLVSGRQLRVVAVPHDVSSQDNATGGCRSRQTGTAWDSLYTVLLCIEHAVHGLHPWALSPLLDNTIVMQVFYNTLLMRPPQELTRSSGSPARGSTEASQAISRLELVCASENIT